ncbi:MAG: DUF3098 domain-containing protein [Methanophagales archaeon]|nr:DUF3098 domain-containing protein [Methanophagales archaeon]
MSLPDYNFASQIVIILAFAMIGGGLKYIDDAFDEDLFSKKKAISIAPILVIIAVILAIKDTAAQTILFSILLSVLIGGKVDNLIFKLSSIAFLLLLSLPSFCLYATLNFLWVPLFIITISGIIDEKGNDYVDENKTNKLTYFFFEHRFTMKIGVLTVCGFQFLEWFYLFAFLTFDGAYESIRIFGYLCRSDKFRFQREKIQKFVSVNHK